MKVSSFQEFRENRLSRKIRTNIVTRSTILWVLKKSINNRVRCWIRGQTIRSIDGNVTSVEYNAFDVRLFHRFVLFTWNRICADLAQHFVVSPRLINNRVQASDLFPLPRAPIEPNNNSAIVIIFKLRGLIAKNFQLFKRISNLCLLF